MQDCCQSRACVFDVEVNLIGFDRLMADQRAAKIRTPIDFDGEFRLEVLCKQLCQNRLFGEILRPHDETGSGSATTRENESYQKEKN
jgi:hypothetical protein